ncbi:MAG: glycosyltransferase [Acidimicrobiia bacterium]
MIDLDIYRGRMVAIVVPGAGSTEATVASLEAVRLDRVDLRVVVAAGRTPADAKNRAATVERVDYLSFVDAGTELSTAHLQAAVDMLREDLSVGLVGWSPGGWEAGELEPFVVGNGCVTRHSSFHAISGFDVALGAGLEDLDLGWRTWLAGWRVRGLGSAPAEVVWGLGEGPDLAERTRRMLAAVLDRTSMGDAWAGPEARQAMQQAAGKRPRVQPTRQRGDGELLPLVHAGVRRWADREPSAEAVAEVLGVLGAPERAGRRRRIAVVTADTVAPRMAGPAIRAVQIARRLAREHEVVLASTESCSITLPGIEVRQVGERGLRELERWCDVFLFQGWVLEGRPYLMDSRKVVVADIYDPMHLEQLEQAYDAPGERGRFDVVRNTTRVLNEQLERADFMVCASAKQRDLWIGALAGLGRVNPVTYDGDESLRRLLAVVPFGVGDEAPVQTRSAIREGIEGIGLDDKVVLWGGGVYNWFDPITLVEAVDRVRHDVPNVRLLFLGMKHPNPGVPTMRVANETVELARARGLMGSHVFFNTEWVEFDDRHNFLLDADVGVSTHLDHIETEFSFRTRILDYLWAELPIVATGGDSFADLIEREEIGIVVPPCDVGALADALTRVLTDEAFAAGCRERIRALTPALRWEACLEPLVEFCRAPARAADVCCPDLDRHAALARLPTGRRRDLAVAMSYFRAGAGRVVLERMRQRVRALRT